MQIEEITNEYMYIVEDGLLNGVNVCETWKAMTLVTMLYIDLALNSGDQRRAAEFRKCNSSSFLDHRIVAESMHPAWLIILNVCENGWVICYLL